MHEFNVTTWLLDRVIVKPHIHTNTVAKSNNKLNDDITADHINDLR